MHELHISTLRARMGVPKPIAKIRVLNLILGIGTAVSACGGDLIIPIGVDPPLHRGGGGGSGTAGGATLGGSNTAAPLGGNADTETPEDAGGAQTHAPDAGAARGSSGTDDADSDDPASGDTDSGDPASGDTGDTDSGNTNSVDTDSGDPASVDTCSLRIGLSGTIEGQTIEGPFGFSSGKWGDRCVSTFFGVGHRPDGALTCEEGFLLLRGLESGLTNGGNGPPRTGTFQSTSGLLHLPPEGDSPDRWFCGGTATVDIAARACSNSIDPTMISFSWSNLRVLSCPGVPVERTIHLTNGNPEDGGESLYASGSGTCGSRSEAYVITRTTDSCGMLEIFLKTDPPRAFLFTSDDDPTPATLFCVGRVVLEPDGSVNLEELSIAGSCADAQPVRGSLAVSLPWP